MSIIIWIDREIYNEENQRYAEEIKQLDNKKLRLFESISGDALDYMKSIQFEETKIIVSGRLFSEFINIFKDNILDICFAPKIIIFTGKEERFLGYNEDYEKNENKFYTFGRIATIIDEVKDFLKMENNNKVSFSISQKNQNDSNNCSISAIKQDESKENNNYDSQLTFEYIDSKDKLILPLLFKTLIDKLSNENMEEYTKLLYNIYSKESKNIKNLLEQILMMESVPVEILAKYYERLYTYESNFQKDINKDLRMNKIDKYMPYIKAFYEGVRLRSLPLSNDHILYRIGNLSNDEINKIKNYLNNKIKRLPGQIVFSKTFLSFSKDEKEAKRYLEYIDKKFPIVLFKLINDNNGGYNLSTHSDIEKISYYPREKEVLFFPYSSFEIKEINNINIENEKGYEIILLYLGKYLKDIENDKNITLNENEIPNTKFKKQICEVGFIEKEKIKKINTKKLYNDFKQYEKDNYKNYITGEIYIKSDDINKDICIINSYEKCKRENKLENYKDEQQYENEKEIKENIEIKINEKIISFSYYHNFEKEGKYIVKYSFKNDLTKTNHMFYECHSIINLNLLNFNTQNITNISNMFYDCNSLINLNLSSFNTQNVINMKGVFANCNSLKNLNLLNFNTKNVINMNDMFYNCNSLTILDLLNFNTQNVTNMSYMFYNCNSLKNLDLSSFDTKNVTDMSYMFSGCRPLINLNLSNFNAQNVTNMSYMFYDCYSLMNLNLSSFNTQNDINMNGIFTNCHSLKRENLVTKDNKILEKSLN